MEKAVPSVLLGRSFFLFGWSGWLALAAIRSGRPGRRGLPHCTSTGTAVSRSQVEWSSLSERRGGRWYEVQKGSEFSGAIIFRNNISTALIDARKRLNFPRGGNSYRSRFLVRRAMRHSWCLVEIFRNPSFDLIIHTGMKSTLSIVEKIGLAIQSIPCCIPRGEIKATNPNPSSQSSPAGRKIHSVL